MAVTKNVSRQYPLAGLADLGIAQNGAGNEVTFKLPPGALLVNLTVDTTVVFNSTTNTLTVSDGTTTFAAAVDTKTLGRETVANLGKHYPTGGLLTVSMAHTGTAPTTGRVFVQPTYVIVGRENEISVV